MTALDLVKTTSPQLNTAGAAFYFHPDTLARGKELGLDGFRFYFLGRGGPLGDCDPLVVASAFGYFHPSIVEMMWTSAQETMTPRDAGREYLECAANLGRSSLADIEGLQAFNDAAEAVVANSDAGSLALFAAISAEPLPDDAAGRAYRNAVNLRELRGSTHLLAIAGAGLSPAVAHAIRRPDDTGMFGWDPAPKVSDQDRVILEQADQRTDELMEPAFAELSDEQSTAFAAGSEAIFKVFDA